MVAALLVIASHGALTRCPGHCRGRSLQLPARCGDVVMMGTRLDNDMSLPRRLERLAAVLRSSGDERERALRLIRLGNSLPKAPLLELGPQSRVSGCVSVVHVLVHLGDDGRLRLSGAADSRLARGLVALLVRGLEGALPEDLERLDVHELARAAALGSALTPGRLNGLEGMLLALRSQLEEERPRQHERRADAAADTPAAVEGGADSPADAPPTHEAATPFESEVRGAPTPRQVQLLWPAAEEEVAVLLSGGVDSSVALHQLLAAGHRCRAFYLRIWLEDEQAHAARGACPWEDDWAYCKAVCKQAGVPLEAVSLQREYQDNVVRYLVTEAAAGRTPNPDIMCNSRIKFGTFQDRVGIHFAHVASGHYARTAPTSADGGAHRAVQLLRSSDAHKDQTYFLSQLSQEQLRSATFPIGGMTKPEVREAAQRLALPNRERKDSQGICFLGQLDYDGFLRDHLGEAPGAVLEHETGEEIGMHRGLWFHTVGQRRGLGPVLSNAYRARGPWHVVRKDMDTNVLYATRSYSAADKARNEFSAHAINWVAGSPPSTTSGEPLPLQVKVRHGAHMHDALVHVSPGGQSAHVHLASRDKGLAPGQFAAFYDGEVCLGSGVIVDGAV